MGIAHEYWEIQDELLVSGWVLRSRREFVLEHLGEEVWQEIIKSLPDDLREMWNHIDINEWYDIRKVEVLEKKVAEKFGKKEEQVYEEMGRFSARRAFDPEKGQYKHFLGKPPELFFKIAARWQNEYYNTGLTEYYPTGVFSCMIRTRYIPYTTRANCRSNLGFFREAIRLLGAQALKAEEAKCIAWGDEWCEFHFEWKPAPQEKREEE